MGEIKIIDRDAAYEAYKNKKRVYIGYENKNDGAFWSFEQMKSYAKGNTDKEKFDSIVHSVKQIYLPHARIKYAICED